MNSIRHRLLLSLLVGLLISTAIMIGVACIDTTNELQGLFADNLRRMAVVIEEQTFTPTQGRNTVQSADTAELEESYVIQTWDGYGNLLHSSRPSVNLPLQTEKGFSQVNAAHRIWQIYTLKADSGYVQIAQPQEIVATMIGESALRALFPLILLFVLMVIGGWVAVGRSLTPLNTLSRTISEWDANNMQPLRISDAPSEIQPVVSALNNMLLKLDKAMSMQQQFTADSAHELRTPLTAIKLQLENLIRAPSEQDRQYAVGKLSEGIDRCIHLASQLLIASRSMAVKAEPEFHKVRLAEIVRSSISSFVIVASEKAIEISFENETPGDMRGDEEGLRVLVNNLIDNALRYTPEGGQVAVRLYSETGKTILEVGDDGPGIPKNERDRIFQRFYRIPGTTATGSGLGLSIVKNVADNHNAAVSIDGGLRQLGATIRITFPVSA
ncbi:MAG: hypothetical protein KGI37_02940 [Alphaproteobacteria bacterium]|nr:hypothetical protein [Alphaproteobacteria bacterium]